MTDNQIERQILIGGCGRSGTTLLGAMLGAHSDCICPPESQFKMDVLRSCEGNGEKVNLPTALNLIKKHLRFKIWEFDISSTEIPEEEMGGSYPRLLEWIVSRYARSHGKTKARIWVDHTPENIRRATTLLELFPQAKMIHIVRDGRAIASSVMSVDWGPNTIIKAAGWWLEMISYGLAAESRLREDQITRVKYEDLVCAPEKTLINLCTFLGIDYQPEMVQAGGFKAPRYTTGQHTLIGQTPDAKRATRWETRLTPRQIEIFENLTHDFLSYLGYPSRYGLKAKAPSLAERCTAGIKELGQGKVINRIRWLKRSYPLWLSWDFLDAVTGLNRES